MCSGWVAIQSYSKRRYALSISIPEKTYTYFAITKLNQVVKKILFFVLAVVALSGCDKEFTDTEPKGSTAGGITMEDIFNATGCKPNNGEDIKTFKLFKDNNNVKYLYGSILIDNIERFWVSQYSDSGELIWEITHKDSELVSYAHNPVQISRDIQ